jgi:pilus assembly protein TadC
MDILSEQEYNNRKIYLVLFAIGIFIGSIITGIIGIIAIIIVWFVWLKTYFKDTWLFTSYATYLENKKKEISGFRSMGCGGRC